MGKYNAPKKRVHRGFVYLDDGVVINSLSALESGKIDEVVAKIAQAREGGLAGGLNAGLGSAGAKIEGGRKATTALEEEVVRTRTRFSIFEIWYQKLLEEKALGTFDGWDASAMHDVEPGDTVEVTGTLELVPLQTLLRLYRWFAAQAQDQGSPFAQKGEQLKATKSAVKTMDALLGGTDEVLLRLSPLGESDPPVAVILDAEWLIGALGRIDGTYTVVAQVEMVLGAGDRWPTVRLTPDAPVTKLEREALTSAVGGFIEPAAALGVTLSTDEAELIGPALLLRAIAVYR
ncbi:hypothetical protein IC744_04115 [Microbacterium hominis]|uniref:DUF6414 family protein n=1 Tax=Microbacterium TaxID=33882 RepID=UPI00168C0152|nr:MULTISPECIES: hypothetical protein [Microbacterium]QOC25563.1 hypothetical protein IC745_14770 [Microbacterium hominis]QOC29564.1 hypothetical protein IC744_04115 [Microbacterium hominis]QYF98063.1 hypothetical protein KY498_02045 [Microbacterium sp. PAMC21962]